MKFWVSSVLYARGTKECGGLHEINTGGMAGVRNSLKQYTHLSVTVIPTGC